MIFIFIFILILRPWVAFSSHLKSAFIVSSMGTRLTLNHSFRKKMFIKLFLWEKYVFSVEFTSSGFGQITPSATIHLLHQSLDESFSSQCFLLISLKYQKTFHKMVKHTQTVRRLFRVKTVD